MVKKTAKKIRTPLQGAFKKGYLAYERQVAREDNPYTDHRTYYGAVTWSRSFRRAWFFGWDEAQSNQRHGDYDGWYEDRIRQGEN